MRGALVMAALLLVASVAAQSTTAQSAGDCANFALLVHHPYPDSADPLGFEWLRSGQDAYYHRYQHLDVDRDGFDFPHTVFDGVVAIEGIPDSSAPYVSTRDAYEAAFQERLSQESPLQIGLDAPVSDGAAFAGVTIQGDVDLTATTLFVALVEDPVHYAPPPAVSNGVTVHPFVVRAMEAVSAPTAGSQGIRIPLDDEWNTEQLYAAAWVQQAATDAPQFDAHEVLQAAIAPVNGAATDGCGTQRAVLMEMYSATWCDTCLFGDRVAEEMAEREGILGERELERAGYLVAQPFSWLWVALAAVAGVALAVVRLPGERR